MEGLPRGYDWGSYHGYFVNRLSSCFIGGKHNMKREETIKVIDETLSDMLSIANEVIEELTYQFEETQNPEKLIGKSYETWTSQDLQLLAQVYGPEDDTPLAKTIFDKEYTKVQELEAEELENA